MDPAERNWHACSIPAVRAEAKYQWRCSTCGQLWVWRRPPRPAAQWVRRDREQR